MRVVRLPAETAFQRLHNALSDVFFAARSELDEAEYVVLLRIAGDIVARLEAERLDRERRRQP